MKALNRSFADYLLEVQSKLQWSDSNMADHLHVTGKDWEKISEGSKEPSLVELSAFAESLELDMERLFEQSLDLNLLCRRLNDGKDSLPERYIPGAFSRVRTSRTLLDFIEFYFGWRMRQKVLNHLNMNEAAIANPERFINVQFFMDICKTMKGFGYSDDILRRMGEFSIYSNRGGVVDRMFSDCPTPREVYEKVVPVLGTCFEKNHRYRILNLGENHCTMEALVQEELLDALKVSKIGSLEGCLTRGGVGASFALYAGPYQTSVKELECIHAGSHRCVFRLEWAPIKQLSYVQ